MSTALLTFYFCLYRWPNVPKFYFPFIGRGYTQSAVSRNLCWWHVCHCKSGFIFERDNKISQTNTHRTSLPQTGHLAISLCRCLFFLEIQSLLKSWCNEDKWDQVTQWEPHDDHTELSSGIYHAYTCNCRDKIAQDKSTPFLGWWKCSILHFPKPRIKKYRPFGFLFHGK